MNTKIKICGLTNLEDALLAVNLGADFLGFIFAESKRQVDMQTVSRIVQKLPPGPITVGVFMDQPIDFVRDVMQKTQLDRIQLHGDESIDFCRALDWPMIKRIRIDDRSSIKEIQNQIAQFPDMDYLIDPGAGDGKTFDWSIIQKFKADYILAGGLNPDNVREAVERLHPFGVDVSSGVESRPGKKDPEKLKRFIEEVRCQ
ncbi:phosphoribosylanthranilate isomerase [candidate division KSB1 bacterium]|nr:phosphoribosylanthranilate isomerase [candidate division KSB1 bacterium]